MSLRFHRWPIKYLPAVLLLAVFICAPVSAQVNFKARVLLFKSLEANETREYNDYKRFNAEAIGYQLEAPKSETSVPAKPKP